jgi:hypothetical protein
MGGVRWTRFRHVPLCAAVVEAQQSNIPFLNCDPPKTLLRPIRLFSLCCLTSISLVSVDGSHAQTPAGEHPKAAHGSTNVAAATGVNFLLILSQLLAPSSKHSNAHTCLHVLKSYAQRTSLACLLTLSKLDILHCPPPLLNNVDALLSLA